jgi:D-inositol-3-phosphate glycosyltransferase
MKLLIVNTSTGWGGLEMNVVKLAHELQKHNIEIHFACQENTMFDQQISPSFSSVLRLKKGRKYFDFSNASVLADYTRKHSIHLLFTAYRPDLDVLMWVKRKARNIRIIHQQQMQIGIPKKGIIQRMRYAAVDLWLTPLHWLKEEALQKTTIQADKIRIVPLGVRKEPFLEEPIQKSEAQQFFGFETLDFVLGVIGRIDEKKGQLFLTKAVKKLLDKGEKVALLIVGMPTIDDPKSIVYNQSLQEFILKNNLESSVFIAPFTKDVNKFYQAIDLFVMSSEGETFGMVTVEALFSKTPVIGTNTSGTPEVLGHGSRGALYAFDNEQSFIDAYFRVKNALQTGDLDLQKIKEEAMQLYALEKEVDGVLNALKECDKRS